jgi:hypothetical protein
MQEYLYFNRYIKINKAYNLWDLTNSKNTINILRICPTWNDGQCRLLLWFSLFHRAFFSSIVDKTPTYAPFTQHYIILACWFH